MRDCGMSMQVLYINNVVKLHITRKEEETMTQKKFSTKYLVEMALLVAIILIMAFTPIGYIRTAGLEITLIVVPVAVGAVTLGPAAGAILGGVFGVTSFIQCFGMSPFGAALLGINGFLTFLVCVRHPEIVICKSPCFHNRINRNIKCTICSFIQIQ